MFNLIMLSLDILSSVCLFLSPMHGCQTTNDTPRRTPKPSQLLQAQILIFPQLLVPSTLNTQDCLSQGYTAAGTRAEATCLSWKVDALSPIHRIQSGDRWPQHFTHFPLEFKNNLCSILCGDVGQVHMAGTVEIVRYVYLASDPGMSRKRNHSG
ncbi:uncharacterized protein LOC26536427 [Drosophila yakuba]|uniref:Uncharacterized protein n=1 Tax=Drosophila yakuba TaxID=7245 RepID=A0A0R1DUW2_DROYA|nr:uncharacterized protein LOC26536427 [Drosophila yakuba]KRJ98953.1 uncharacterized protein Dyak_GE29246 [Drosophila yakuba]